jgi:hypothetical protein
MIPNAGSADIYDIARFEAYPGDESGGGEDDGGSLGSVDGGSDIVLQGAGDAGGGGLEVEGAADGGRADALRSVELGGGHQGRGRLASNGGGHGVSSLAPLRSVSRELPTPNHARSRWPPLATVMGEAVVMGRLLDKGQGLGTCGAQG